MSETPEANQRYESLDREFQKLLVDFFSFKTVPENEELDTESWVKFHLGTAHSLIDQMFEINRQAYREISKDLADLLPMLEARPSLQAFVYKSMTEYIHQKMLSNIKD